jgi:hypothetical protein
LCKGINIPKELKNKACEKDYVNIVRERRVKDS